MTGHRTAPFCMAGAAVFAIVATGAAAQDNGGIRPDGYTIETVALPEGVPFHVTGLDVNEAGDVAVATRLGEVWILDGGEGEWRRFAEGLAEATGLLWADDGSILVAHKPELTRVADTDGDGTADNFAAVADGWTYHDNYHEYNFGPVRDGQGGLIGTLNLGHGNPDGYGWGESPVMVSAGGHRGWAYRVDANGQLSFFASGLRSPAGLGTGPDGKVYYTDNQGDWVPTSKLHVLRPGAFYGHPSSLRDAEGFDIASIDERSIADFAVMAETPVVWFPHQEVANSPGNPVWDMSDGAFGPFAGQAFVGDQTQSNVVRIILEEVAGQQQGAVIPFADGFQSGNIRLAFDPEGALWVGQTSRGWGSKGPEPFGLQKLVWDGETTPFELQDIAMTPDGFELTFTEPVDAASVSDGALQAESWSYRYSDAYGSDKIGLKSVPIEKASLSEDGTRLSVAIERRPSTVVAIDFGALSSASSRSVTSGRVYYTVNAVPGEEE